jgi:hypothetical protein
MFCQLMEMIVPIHFCGQDGKFFDIGCCINYEILLKNLRYYYFPVFPINMPAAASHWRPVHCYIIVTYTVQLAKLLIFMVVWVGTPF